MRHFLLFLICCVTTTVTAQEITSVKTENLLSYVNPLTGTGVSTTANAHRHGRGTEQLAQIIPAVTYPFGMTNWTPQTQSTEKKCLAPYYYRDSLLQGFRGSHWMSGSCTQDYGSVTLMPVSGQLVTDEEERASLFSHEEETATPAYYSVQLSRYNTFAELTATKRCGLFRFTFPDSETAHIVVNPNSDENQGFIEIDTVRNEIRGYNPVHRIYQGWGEPTGFSGYFIVQFNQSIQQFGTFQRDVQQAGQLSLQNAEKLGAYASFGKLKEPLLVRVGTSFTTMENARQNLEAEIPDWNFDKLRAQLENVWNEALNHVQVKGSEDNKTIFYTALFHSMQLPRLFSDVSGDYPKFSDGSQTMKTDGFEYYDDFSMWDVYRAQLPLVHLLFPDKSRDMVRSMVLKAEQGGWLPIFPSWNSYTAAMIGDHCTSFLADAYAKGIRDFDTETAYRYMRQNAFEQPTTFEEYKNGKGRRALDSYLTYNYIPMEDSVQEAFHKKEQASRTLEYAYDDFALAQFAKAIGKTADYELLIRRSQNYKNVYDPTVGYIRGRYADGRWYEQYDASKQMPYITEGTPRHYTWYVPHDVEGLIQLMGGRNNFNTKLDSMFSQNFYWHGNEPGHQTVYLFNYSGQPWKTQQYVRKIMAEEYGIGPGGLSGNDDAGQMSAWYVFSAMGFYPVCPGMDEYVLGSPLFEEVQIQGKDGVFIIHAEDSSAANQYIQSARLNGETFEKTFLKHGEISGGGVLQLEMGDVASDWGTGAGAVPFSVSR